MSERPDRVCTKRPYTSARVARLAHRRANFRIRTYWCDVHRAYHATNHDKRDQRSDA